LLGQNLLVNPAEVWNKFLALFVTIDITFYNTHVMHSTNIVVPHVQNVPVVRYYAFEEKFANFIT